MTRMPFRYAVNRALQVAFQQITVANGYSTDVSAVHLGRAFLGEKEPLPAVTILEPDRPFDTQHGPDNSSLEKGDYVLLVQGFVKGDPDEPLREAYEMAADIQQCLARENAKRNNILNLASIGENGISPVIQIRRDSPVVRPPDAISITEYCWVPIQLKLVEDDNDPWVDWTP